MATQPRTSQIKSTTAKAMIGSVAGDNLDTLITKINDETAKLFEDRNFILAGGGTITVNGTGTSVTFSAALKLHVNSLVAGGSPSIIDLASTTRAFTTDGNMLYTVINRTAATAVVTADSSTLPTVVAANQEVVLIAKRIGTSIFFRNGVSIPAGVDRSFDDGVVGSTGGTTNQLIKSNGTGGKKVQATGITVDGSNNMTGVASQTVATNIITGTERENISTDSTTTGSNATLATPTTPIVRLTNASLVSIDMLVAGASGQQQTIMNVTGAAITLNNLTGGTAANQFLTGIGANLSIANNASVIIKYDDTSSKWRIISATPSPTISTTKIAVISEHQASGVAAGTSIAGFQTRVLNTISDPFSIVTSLAGNTFTLPAGTYHIQATATVNQPDGHQLVLYNSSDTTYDIIGASLFSNSLNFAISSNSFFSGIITISSSKDFNIGQYIQTAKLTNGLGIANALSSLDEVYTIVTITKL